jgi:SAM-dependent methyltransferase
MDNGWNDSARAWIAAMGERGDWGREHVLDAVMLSRVGRKAYRCALDVGCGEGRFCRLLRDRGIDAVGIDPTLALIEEARRRDADGQYQIGKAEKLPFEDGRFDLVVSYLTLIDIADFRAAIGEMTRVLRIGGTLLIANLTSFTSACADQGWVSNEDGLALYYPVDRYLEEFAQWVEWKGIRIENWHRPLGAYMTELLEKGLVLRFFQEPGPIGGNPERASLYCRAPWFVVMEWVAGMRMTELLGHPQ